MALRPEILLSKASRARCIANIKELPTLLTNIAIDRKHASVLVPLCVINGEVNLLYTLRSANLSTHKGQVSFPGGKKDLNESDVETALRETEEEIGFPRDNVDVWAEMKQVQGRDKKMVITPIVGYLKNFEQIDLRINSEEVDEVFTVPMDVFCDQNNHAHFMFKNLPLPIFLCGKHRIWGITGMITHMFLQSFLPDELYNPNFMNKSYELEELMPSKL